MTTTTTTITRDEVTITPCGCGRLVRLTHRWDPFCARCGQLIGAGAVGPLTADDCRTDGTGRHGWATWSHEHGCGAWNSPLEVTVHLDDHGDDLADAVDAGLLLLTDLVAESERSEREHILELLADAAGAAADHLPWHVDDGCEDCPITGTDEAPGVFLDGGRLVAWTWDPTSWDPDAGALTSTLETDRILVGGPPAAA